MPTIDYCRCGCAHYRHQWAKGCSFHRDCAIFTPSGESFLQSDTCKCGHVLARLSPAVGRLLTVAAVGLQIQRSAPGEMIPGLRQVYYCPSHLIVGRRRGFRMSAAISRTAASSPTSAARAMIECPMFSSSISGMVAMPSMLR